MKEKDAFVDYSDHQMVMYVEKDDGTYGTMRTASYMAATYIDDFWEKQRNLELDCFNKLISGLYSPVAYYLVIKDMTPADVGARIKLSAGAVKKHMKPENFGKISIDIARRYAEVFGVNLAQMFQVTPPSAKDMRIAFEKTANPYAAIVSGAKGPA